MLSSNWVPLERCLKILTVSKIEAEFKDLLMFEGTYNQGYWYEMVFYLCLCMGFPVTFLYVFVDEPGIPQTR